MAGKHPYPPAISFSQVITTYPVMRVLLQNLQARDVVNLGVACPEFGDVVFKNNHPNPNEGTLRNSVLSLTTVCYGSGPGIRDRHHKRSTDPLWMQVYDDPTIWKLQCFRDDTTVEVNHCVSCERIVCNTCRVHFLYQTLVRELPNGNYRYAGYVLLEPDAIRMKPPFAEDDPDYEEDEEEEWDHWRRMNEQWESHTSQTLDMYVSFRLDHPNGEYYAEDDSGDIKAFREFIYQDLGSGPVRLWNDLGSIRSPMLEAFQRAAERRKRFVCLDCHSEENLPPQCKCSLATLFLDPWRCLSCYQTERDADIEYLEAKQIGWGGMFLNPLYGRCNSCDLDVATNAVKRVSAYCNWCDGVVNVDHNLSYMRLCIDWP